MLGWTISEWRQQYRDGAKPAALLTALRATLSTTNDPAWIAIIGSEALSARLAALDTMLQDVGGDMEQLSLFGIPFAAKDNIDVAGLDTTAGCPAFAYAPTRDATVIRRLIAAGAIVIGKANLDQFATGLVGVRSPYGIPSNPFDADYIVGGSSAGSASLVARGIVPFALGTDTAGSGRVPAGLNNIIGLKPTRGALSNTGIVPACRTLDCVSIFATTVDDVAEVYDIAAALDPDDGFSRMAPAESQPGPTSAIKRIGIPSAPIFFGDTYAAEAFDQSVARLASLDIECVPIDFSVFDKVSALLYDGAWIAERYAAIRSFAADHENDIHPVVRQVIFKAQRYSAADAFDDIYRLADLKRSADAVLAGVDALMVPTAPRHYRIDEVAADPIRLNSTLGTYTNFVNLLDWSAIAVPATLRADGLPFGITLIGAAWQEARLIDFATRWHRASGLTRGATGRPLPSVSIARVKPAASAQDITLADNAKAPASIRLAVVGAHLRGMPLNHELLSRQARFVAAAQTAEQYRLVVLPNTVPSKPGLFRSRSGASIQLELWDIPSTHFGSFVAGIPAPLGIGTVTLLDGTEVKGFICEPYALEDALDITAFGGWVHYLASLPCQDESTAPSSL